MVQTDGESCRIPEEADYNKFPAATEAATVTDDCSSLMPLALVLVQLVLEDAIGNTVGMDAFVAAEGRNFPWHKINHSFEFLIFALPFLLPLLLCTFCFLD